MTFEFDDRDRESVLRDLASEDEEVRRLAVERVTALRVDEAISHLTDRIGDSSWRVRKAAVERLVACPDTAPVIDALITALADDDNTGRRNSAVEALQGCGSSAVPKLEAALESADSDVRKLVVDTLAGIGEESSVSLLVAKLEDSDANVRAAVAEALGAIGGDAAARALHGVAVREDEKHLVRFSALHAMSLLEVPLRASDLAPILGDPVLRAAGLALLGLVDDDDATSELLKALGAAGRSVREAAIGSLLRTVSRLDESRADRLVTDIRAAAEASPLVVESAVSHLADGNLPTRLMLVQFLGIVGAEEAVVPLLRAAHDEALTQIVFANLEAMGSRCETVLNVEWEGLETHARRNACHLFGHMQGALSSSRLLASLEDPDPEIRNAAATSIGQRRLVDALPALLHRLECAALDDDFENREELATLTEALIDLARPVSCEATDATARVVECLTASIEGAAAPVRLAVATVIGRVGRQEDSHVIELLLKDPSPLTRRAAVEAFARLDCGTAAESLRLALGDEASTVRIAAASALGASKSDDVIEDLCCLAADDDTNVRAAAVRAAGSRVESASPGADIGPAMNLIDAALEDEAVVALAAVDALCHLGGRGIERMLRVVDRPEPELVQAAVRCIGESGELGALEALLALISHPDWTVRAETIQVLADRGLDRAVPPILRRLELEQDEFVRAAILRALDRLGG